VLVSQRVHVDAANEVTMTDESAGFAVPHSASRLLLSMPACRTLAAGPSLRASEALDAGLLTLVSEVIYIFAVFPLRHALVVTAAFVSVAYSVGVADVELSHLLLFAEGNHLPGSLVAEIAHAALSTRPKPVLGALQLPPTSGIFLAPELLFGEASQLLIAVALEAANAPPRDDERCSRAP
jgi:hypothetical protein